MRSDSIYVEKSMSVDGGFRLNKSLPFCFFATRGVSVVVATALHEEEEDEVEEEV
jgi:hypothetical protein